MSHILTGKWMPYRGLKSSGYGKDLSIVALDDYTVACHVMLKF